MTIHLCLPSEHLRALRAVESIKERLNTHTYVSQAAKRHDENFVRKIESQQLVYEWFEKHYPEFKPNPKDANHLCRPILLPFFDAEKRVVVPADSFLYIRYDAKEKTHWVSASHDFMNKRLDWSPMLFLDILENQDRFDEWCKDYTETLMGTEFWWTKF